MALSARPALPPVGTMMDVRKVTPTREVAVFEQLAGMAAAARTRRRAATVKHEEAPALAIVALVAASSSVAPTAACAAAAHATVATPAGTNMLTETVRTTDVQGMGERLGLGVGDMVAESVATALSDGVALDVGDGDADAVALILSVLDSVVEKETETLAVVDLLSLDVVDGGGELLLEVDCVADDVAVAICEELAAAEVEAEPDALGVDVALGDSIVVALPLADALGVIGDVDVMLAEEEAELLGVPLADVVAAELALGEPEALDVATLLNEGDTLEDSKTDAALTAEAVDEADGDIEADDDGVAAPVAVKLDETVAKMLAVGESVDEPLSSIVLDADAVELKDAEGVDVGEYEGEDDEVAVSVSDADVLAVCDADSVTLDEMLALTVAVGVVVSEALADDEIEYDGDVDGVGVAESDVVPDLVALTVGVSEALGEPAGVALTLGVSEGVEMEL